MRFELYSSKDYIEFLVELISSRMISKSSILLNLVSKMAARNTTQLCTDSLESSEEKT